MKNLIGSRVGKLQIISLGPDIKNSRSQPRPSWNCICDCGKSIALTVGYINHIKNCGCDAGVEDLTGQLFTRLTPFSYEGGLWLCSCSCGSGKISQVSIKNLKRGNTQSCGCLKSEHSSKQAKLNIPKLTKHTPQQASAARALRRYNKRNKVKYKVPPLNLQDFMNVVTNNCAYCGALPHLEANAFDESDSYSQYGRDNGLFTYNSMDRVDNFKGYLISNVVPACVICNSCKSDMTLVEFCNWVDNLKIDHDFNYLDYQTLQIPKNCQKSSINECYYMYSQDSEMTIEQFHYVSQMNCFYCDCNPNNSNCYNRANIQERKGKIITEGERKESEFRYNGCDRIDSKLGHNLNNIVPCCYTCNRAKSDRTFDEFINWVKRIKKFRSENPNLDISKLPGTYYMNLPKLATSLSKS